MEGGHGAGGQFGKLFNRIFPSMAFAGIVITFGEICLFAFVPSVR